MYCIIQFYVQMKKPLEEHRPFLKVLAIKLVVFLSFWQITAVTVATNERFKLFEPNSVIAYPDIKVGSPAAILCIEMAFFAILHLWAYPYAPYVPGAKIVYYPVPDERKADYHPREESVHQDPSGGTLGLLAFVDAMNPWDFVKAFGRGMRWLFYGVKLRHHDGSNHDYKNRRMSSWDLDNLTNPHTGAKNKYTRSTEHLPIADQFRRSRFGLSGFNDVSRRDEDSDGLISHAQPNPTSAMVGRGGMGASLHPDSATYGGQSSYRDTSTPWPSSPYHGRGSESLNASSSYYEQTPRTLHSARNADWEPSTPRSGPRNFSRAFY